MANWKQVSLAILVASLLGAGYWYYLVVSFESDLGTNNTIVFEDDSSALSNSTNDSLLSISFDDGSDDLAWSYTSITIDDGTSTFDCTLGGLSSSGQQTGKVQSNLNADGQTFTVLVDATSETSFTQMSLPMMSETESNSFSLRFSKTDIYLGENISWMSVDEIEFNQLTAVPEGNFSNDTSERLDWYDYDLSAHRVEPLNRLFLVNEGQTIYKIQFLNYYNEDDESRHVTFIVSLLSGEQIPAMNDPNLVQSSPCIISDDDSVWSHNETIHLWENGVDICNSSCILKITVNYENIEVKGTESISLA